MDNSAHDVAQYESVSAASGPVNDHQYESLQSGNYQSLEHVSDPGRTLSREQTEDGKYEQVGEKQKESADAAYVYCDFTKRQPKSNESNKSSETDASVYCALSTKTGQNKDEINGFWRKHKTMIVVVFVIGLLLLVIIGLSVGVAIKSEIVVQECGSYNYYTYTFHPVCIVGWRKLLKKQSQNPTVVLLV